MSDPLKVKDAEYIGLFCRKCGERCKLAKNKGADWIAYNDMDWTAEFFLMHSCCNQSDIEILYED